MTGLIRYEAARHALAEARNVDEVKDLHDKAEAMRQYARMAKDVQMEVDAAEIRVRAERRLGELLFAQKQSEGMNRGALRRGSDEAPRDDRPTLADQGIDKKLSSRAQKVALVPEEEFETAVKGLRDQMIERQGRVTLDIIRERAKATARAAHQAKIVDGGTIDDLHALAAGGYKAGVILADPPWHFMTRSPKGEGRSAGQHYTTDPLDEIKALPVGQLAADDCVLFMWMVDWAPAAALEVLEAWGFEHKTTAFTWVKQNRSEYGMFMGQGYWTRANPEQCWLATKGNPKRLNADVRQLLIAKISEHSRKPEEIYQRVERLVGGPYLELYARRPREGWTSWGNELPPPQIAPSVPPHDPATGEILEEFPENPERSRLMPDPARIAKLADEEGFVQVDDETIVDGRFITAGQLAQAESFARREWVRQVSEEIKTSSQANAVDEATPTPDRAVDSDEEVSTVVTSGSAVDAEAVSRLAARRSAAATSETMDVTGGESAATPSGEPVLPNFLRRKRETEAQ